MAGQLTDDGTMDTVIRCSECGHEQRYTYDAAGAFEDVIDVEPTDAEASAAYNEWVDWCIEDFDSEHECAQPCPNDGDDPDHCDVCQGHGNRCPVFVATHPRSPVALSASRAVKLLADEWLEDNPPL